MLAAGVGDRLGYASTRPPPKILLRFGGKSLLQYHIEILKQLGINELVLGVGYRHQDIEREIAALGAQHFVRTVFNKDYLQGSIVTLWTLRDELCGTGTVLLMDADVLYGGDLLARLVHSRSQNCLLIDRKFDPGDEPVKVCVRDGKIIEFRKWLSTDFDFCGESVGFFKLSAAVARKIILQTELYLRMDRRFEPYEETIRDVLLTSSHDTFGFEDITDMPWTEIDFAADIEHANRRILPSIVKMLPHDSTATMPRREIEQAESVNL